MAIIRYDGLIGVRSSFAENLRIGNALKAFADTATLHPFFLYTLFVHVGKKRKHLLVLGKLASKGVEGVVACVALGRIGMRQRLDTFVSPVELLGDLLAGSAGQERRYGRCAGLLVPEDEDGPLVYLDPEGPNLPAEFPYVEAEPFFQLENPVRSTHPDPLAIVPSMTSARAATMSSLE